VRCDGGGFGGRSEVWQMEASPASIYVVEGLVWDGCVWDRRVCVEGCCGEGGKRGIIAMGMPVKGATQVG
jgi:hypothetical protein